MVSPEEPTQTRQRWKIDVTVGKEEAASGLTPGGGDRTAGTRAPEEGGTEPGPESLAEAGMQAARDGESPWRRKGKIRTGRGRRDGERGAVWVPGRDGTMGRHCPYWPSQGPPRATGTVCRRGVGDGGWHRRS